MENIELVEKLVEKTGVSYTQAKKALEATDWDILEAIIKLEAEGKSFGGKKTASYTTKNTEEEPKAEPAAKSQSKKTGENEENFKDNMSRFGQWAKRVFDKGNTNSIRMSRKGEEKLTVPVTVFVIVLLVGFWVIIPLMIVGLFFGCSYSFVGPDLGKEKINNAMGKANDVADSIKNEIKNEMKDKSDKDKSTEE